MMMILKKYYSKLEKNNAEDWLDSIHTIHSYVKLFDLSDSNKELLRDSGRLVIDMEFFTSFFKHKHKNDWIKQFHDRNILLNFKNYQKNFIVESCYNDYDPFSSYSFKGGDSDNIYLNACSADFETMVYLNKHYVCSAGYYISINGFTKYYSTTLNHDIPESYIPTNSEIVIKDFLYSLELDIRKVWSDKHMRIQPPKYNVRGLYIIYFHNLSGFDGLLLMDWVLNICNISTNAINASVKLNNRSYKIKLLFYKNTLHHIKLVGKDFTILIKDSYQILPSSLAQLGLDFIGESKDILSTNFFPITINKLQNIEYRIALSKYLKQDVILLYKVLNSYFSIVFNHISDSVNPILISSQASFSYKLFKTIYLNNMKLNTLIPHQSTALTSINYDTAHNLLFLNFITKNEPSVDKFVRESYYGGRTELLKPVMMGGYYIDINSSYPFSMTKKLPSGYGFIFDKKDVLTPLRLMGDGSWNYLVKKLLPTQCFLHCVVHVPLNTYFPIVPSKDPNGKTVYRVGIMDTHLYLPELLAAIKYNNVKIITIHNICVYSESDFLSDCVNSLYNERSKANSSKNRSLSKTYKLILNSLYGKFAFAPEKSDYTFHYNDDNVLSTYFDWFNSSDTYMSNSRITIRRHSNKCTTYRTPSAGVLRLLDTTESKTLLSIKSKLDPIFRPSTAQSSVHIASAIASYSRIHLSDAVFRYHEMHNSWPHYMDTDSMFIEKPFDPALISSTKLGSWKIERYIKMGVFLSGKVYSYIDKHMVDKNVFKGVPNPPMFNEYIDYYTTICEKRSHINKNLLINKPISRNSKTVSIYDNNYTATFSLPSKNRLLIFDKNLWVDTNPFISHNTLYHIIIILYIIYHEQL